MEADFPVAAHLARAVVEAVAVRRTPAVVGAVVVAEARIALVAAAAEVVVVRTVGVAAAAAVAAVDTATEV